jgi:hypothetical protein
LRCCPFFLKEKINFYLARSLAALDRKHTESAQTLKKPLCSRTVAALFFLL